MKTITILADFDGFAVEVQEVVLDTCALCETKDCCRKFYVPLAPSESRRLEIDPLWWSMKAAILAKKPNGDCVYLKDSGCGIWAERPICCREYSCIGDSRIGRAVS